MRRFFVVALALLLIAASVLPLAAILPLHEDIAQVTQAVQQSVGTDTPGAAVVLFENGKCIFYEGYGYTNMEERTLVTVESFFEIGELSSLFVMLAAQKLIDQNLLDPEEDIREYLPAEFMEKLNLTYGVNMYDLLYGRAGFADRYFDLRYEQPSFVFDTLAEALLADVPFQVAKPGEMYAFSRFGITLAAYVIECICGSDYATYTNEEVLKPLGMMKTALAAHRREDETAVGYIAKGEGSFAAAKGAGRTYSALWPADGAVSNAAELALLMQYLLNDRVGRRVLTSYYENGIFQTGPAGLAVSGTARAVTSSTAYFSASLSFDPQGRYAALVLSNVADTALLRVPYDYVGFVVGKKGEAQAVELPETSVFEGEYVLCTKVTSVSQSNAYEGDEPNYSYNLLYAHEMKNLHFAVNEDGVLCVGDHRLVQIAPGIFADSEKPDVAVLQFRMNDEGEVIDVISATGKTYRVAQSEESDKSVKITYTVLLVLSAYFVLGGVLIPLDAVRSRMRHGKRSPKRRALRFTIPWVLAAVSGLTVLIELAVCRYFGSTALVSFFEAAWVVFMISRIATVLAFTWALITSLGQKRMRGRVVFAGVVYLIFCIFCTVCGIG